MNENSSKVTFPSEFLSKALWTSSPIYFYTLNYCNFSTISAIDNIPSLFESIILKIYSGPDASGKYVTNFSIGDNCE